MPKNSSQKFKVSALPQVAHGKRVPAGVGRTADALYADLVAGLFEVALKIADCKIGPVPGREDQVGALALLPPKEQAAQFKGHGYEPFLGTLAFYPHNQSVKSD